MYKRGDVLIATKQTNDYYTITQEGSIVVFMHQVTNSVFVGRFVCDEKHLKKIEYRQRLAHDVKEIANAGRDDFDFNLGNVFSLRYRNNNEERLFVPYSLGKSDFVQKKTTLPNI